MTTGNYTRRAVLTASAAVATTLAFPSPILAQATSPLHFLVVGDWGRRGHAYQKHVARQMGLEAARTGSKFVVSTGDNFYRLGVSSVHDSHWNESFDNIYIDHSLQTPWYPVLGNHDYGGNIYAQIERSGICPRWRMPERWHKISGAQHGRPDIDLFFIDTAVWIGKESLPFSILGSSVSRHDQYVQKQWLMQCLKDSDASFKLVFGHYPIYSIGPHGGHASLQDLDDLLIQTGVTAYVCGHDHCLYHITSQFMIPGQSQTMHYICSGGGSEELVKFTGDPSLYGCVLSGQCSDPKRLVRWQSFVDRAGFASFSLIDQHLHFKLIDRFGVVFHEQSIGSRKSVSQETST